MAGKKTRQTPVQFADLPSEQMRRVWLAGLGVFSLTRKHGGEWAGRFAEEGQHLATRAVRFARETVADTRAHAVGAIAPLASQAEKRWETCAGAMENGIGRVLNRLGIPTKRNIEDLTRHIAALSRRLKAAK